MIGEDTVRDTFVTNLAGRAGWDTPEVAVDIDTAPATDEATAAVEATAYSYEADAPTSPKQRTVNPLVAGLVRAMLDAAETARQEAITGLADAAKARKDQIQVESTESEAEARRVTDSDIAEIREWSKAQMARIRGETDVRITDRKHQLEGETGELSALHQHRLDHVQHVVEAYESEMDAFFQTLFTQDDPAHTSPAGPRDPSGCSPCFDKLRRWARSGAGSPAGHNAYPTQTAASPFRLTASSQAVPSTAAFKLLTFVTFGVCGNSTAII